MRPPYKLQATFLFGDTDKKNLPKLKLEEASNKTLHVPMLDFSFLFEKLCERQEKSIFGKSYCTQAP